MADSGRGPDGAFRLVAQEVKGAGLCDIVPAVRVGGGAGGVVRQGIDGAAVDHAVGVFALRPDGQLEYRPVPFHGFHLDKIMVHEAVFLLPLLNSFFDLRHETSSFLTFAL